jgi:hypothetical protein
VGRVEFANLASGRAEFVQLQIDDFEQRQDVIAKWARGGGRRGQLDGALAAAAALGFQLLLQNAWERRRAVGIGGHIFS